MKTKLKKFNEFSHSLLPHEADYLESKARFSDPEKERFFHVCLPMQEVVSHR